MSRTYELSSVKRHMSNVTCQMKITHLFLQNVEVIVRRCYAIKLFWNILLNLHAMGSHLLMGFIYPFYCFLKPFQVNVPFLYPLRTSEKTDVFWSFHGVWKWNIVLKWVKMNIQLILLEYSVSFTEIYHWMNAIIPI